MHEFHLWETASGEKDQDFHHTCRQACTCAHTPSNTHIYLTLEVFIVFWSFQAVKLALMKESASNMSGMQPGTGSCGQAIFIAPPAPQIHLFFFSTIPPPPSLRAGAPSGSLHHSPSLLSPSLSLLPVWVAFGKLANCVLLTWVHVLSGDQLFV